MKTLQTLQLLILVALALSTGVAGKCPTGSVTIRGRVENLPSGVTAAEIAVVVETPKGKTSKTASVSNGEFTAEVPFSTLSSSILGGDRCNNEPTAVVVRIVAAGRVYVQKSIPFKNSFDMYGPSLYRLKQDLYVDVPKERPSDESPRQ